MNRKCLTAFIAIALMACQGNPVYAQQSAGAASNPGPSLEETLKFVVNPLLRSDGQSDGVPSYHVYAHASLPDGSVGTEVFLYIYSDYQVRVHHHSRDDDYDEVCDLTENYNVLLNSLDPTSVRVSDTDPKTIVAIPTNGETKYLTLHIISHNCEGRNSGINVVGEFKIHYRDADYALRASKALRHAIELVGGKQSSF
jgi:hypothetical protein